MKFLIFDVKVFVSSSFTFFSLLLHFLLPPPPPTTPITICVCCLKIFLTFFFLLKLALDFLWTFAYKHLTMETSKIAKREEEAKFMEL